MRVACLWLQGNGAAARATERVAEQCLRFSPQICIRGHEAVFVEVGKCAKIYSETSFRARMQVILRRLGIKASLAIGSDIPEALLMAKYNCAQIHHLGLEALLDLADPFARDPVARKCIERLIAAFADLGVCTIEQFIKIPLAEFSTRFGPIGILCRQRAKGEMTIPWPHWKPSEVIFEKTDFPQFAFYGELEPILFELKKHLDSIFQRLYARNLRAQRMELKIFVETNSLNLEPFRKFAFDFLFAQSGTKGTLAILRERLSREFQRVPIRSPIEGLETTVTATVPGVISQRDLLHSREETAEQLSSLLNQLCEVHGKERIFHAELTEDRRPEASWRKVQHEGKGSHPAVLIQGRIPLRPTYLLTPEKIEVTKDFIHIRKKPFRVLKWSQTVERISGGWIENHAGELICAYDRNYYQVELDSGALITLFETPKKEFFLHGYFG